MSEYELIAKAIRYMEENFQQQPGVEELAGALGVSLSHFHRLFRRWAGITPKNFLQHLTVVEAKKLLSGGNPVLDTALDVGLSGPGRLHDLCVNIEAASPGEIASKGKGWVVKAGFCQTPFGEAFIAESPRGICRFEFVDSEGDREFAVQAIRESWSAAEIIYDDARVEEVANRIFLDQDDSTKNSVQVFVKGTNFQVKVWRALLEVGSGELATYGEVARRVQSPKAQRAVGSAIGQNELAFLIPCHRVIRASGEMGGYRWGETRKKSMLVYEHAKKRGGF